jgi:hypothetical protein
MLAGKDVLFPGTTILLVPILTVPVVRWLFVHSAMNILHKSY